MEVDELEAVSHVVGLEVVECSKQLAGVEAKLAAVATALFPLAATAARQLDADANVRLYAQSLSNSVDEDELVELLHHEVDATTHLLCQQGEFHIALILVAVAYDERVGADVGHVDGKYGVELGL